jgi:hypothetical protein
LAHGRAGWRGERFPASDGPACSEFQHSRARSSRTGGRYGALKAVFALQPSQASTMATIEPAGRARKTSPGDSFDDKR